MGLPSRRGGGDPDQTLTSLVMPGRASLGSKLHGQSVGYRFEVPHIIEGVVKQRRLQRSP
jgi:hypothetical protein